MRQQKHLLGLAGIPVPLFPKRLRLWHLRREVRALEAFHVNGALDPSPAADLQSDFAEPLWFVCLFYGLANIADRSLQLGRDAWIWNVSLLLAILALYLAILFYRWGARSRAALGFEMRYMFMGKPDTVAAKALLNTRREELAALSS